MYGKPCKRHWVAKVVFLKQMLLTFSGRYNLYFWDPRLKIHRLLNFNNIILFQLVLTKSFNSELFSCLPKVDHVIKSCKEPIHQLLSLFTNTVGYIVHIIHFYTFNVSLSYHSLSLTSHFPSPNFHLFFHSLHIPLVSPLLPLHSTLPTIFPIVSSIRLGLLSKSCGPLGWKSCLTDLPTLWCHREQSQGSCTV